MVTRSVSETGSKGRQPQGTQFRIFAGRLEPHGPCQPSMGLRGERSGCLQPWLYLDFPALWKPLYMCYAHMRPRNLVLHAGFRGLEFKNYDYPETQTAIIERLCRNYLFP